MADLRTTAATNLTAAIQSSCGRRSVRILRAIGRTASELGAEAYLVGGVVRDVMLGLTSHDLDVVVVGDAAAVGQRIATSYGFALRWHPAFGTARLTVDAQTHLDLVTARRERYRAPAALPIVEAAGLDDDLARRDFTINAIAVQLRPRRFGVVVDPLGGRDDLRRRSIRVMHDRSFIDDPTRSFRAVRLGERLRFRLEPRTARSMLEATRAGLIDQLSARRLLRELTLLFAELAIWKAARALERRELLAAIHPSLSLGGRRLDELRRVERALSWYAKGNRRPAAVRWVAALGSLSVGGTTAFRRQLVDRLKPSRHESDSLLEIARQAPRVLTKLSGANRRLPSRVREICDDSTVESLLVALGLADRVAARSLRSYLDAWRGVRADIRGSDLLHAGIVPGPAVARGLAAALRAKLDGRAQDAPEQLSVALRTARRA